MNMALIPENITKEYIIKAIHEIDEKGIRKGRHSSFYDLSFEGKLYPPKLIFSIANRFANGTELDPGEFHGGKDTPAFEILRKEGFVIVEKLDPVKSLIENYKKHITSKGLEDEIYKWKLLIEFKGRPDTNALDFYQEIKTIKFQNLIYQLGAAVLNHLAKERPEELRSLFKFLYDETKDLDIRKHSVNPVF